MHCQCLWNSTALKALGLCLAGTVAAAQGAGGPGQPWRGAGPQPCFGADGGVLQCAAQPRTIVVRAGRLFDTNTGRGLHRVDSLLFPDMFRDQEQRDQPGVSSESDWGWSS